MWHRRFMPYLMWSLRGASTNRRLTVILMLNVKVTIWRTICVSFKDLVGFYSIVTLVGYLILNPPYAYGL